MKLLSALTLLSFALFSCSSGDNPETQEQEQIETNKFVKTERVNNDFKSDYVYNTENMLTKATGTRTSFSYESDFVYNSNGYITEDHYLETGTGGFSSDTFFNYNTEGKLVSYDTVNLSYTGNLITATGTIEGNLNATIELETNTSGLITKLSETDNYTVFEYDSNSNLITAKNYTNSDVLLTTFNVNYDQMKNPFYGQMESIYLERFIEFFYPFEGVFVGGYEGYSFPFFKNNIVAISENSNSVVTRTYTYDSANYPTSVNEDSSGDLFQFSIEYY